MATVKVPVKAVTRRPKSVKPKSVKVVEPKIKPIKRPSAKQFRFGYLVHDVSRIRRVVMDEVMRPYGITRAQWSMLSTLSRGGNNGMMQVDIARLLDVGKVTVGGLIDRLEASGHVERRADAEDRRAKRVYITEKGYDVIQLMIAVASKINRRSLKGVSAEDLEVVERSLVQIKRNLREIADEANITSKAREKGEDA